MDGVKYFPYGEKELAYLAEHFRSAKERRQSLQLHTELTRALHEGEADEAAWLVREIIKRADENLSGGKKRK